MSSSGADRQRGRALDGRPGGAQEQDGLALNIAVGSSIQVALFVAPLLVLLSYAVGPRPMDLGSPPSRSSPWRFPWGPWHEYHRMERPTGWRVSSFSPCLHPRDGVLFPARVRRASDAIRCSPGQDLSREAARRGRARTGSRRRARRVLRTARSQRRRQDHHHRDSRGAARCDGR